MMYRSILALTLAGKSHEEIIEQILGMDNYVEGQRTLKALLSLGQQRGWSI